MKAILIREFGGPEQLYLGEWEQPVPDPKEILVRVKATALNRADTLQRKGNYPPPFGASPILGLEMAGVVEGIGAEVGQWKIGDKVCGLLAGGGYAEYVIIHESLAMPIPGDLSFEQAAAIPEVFLTAFQAMWWLAQVQAQEKILIHAGASGVGTAAIQLAKLQEAEIYVTASAPKHQICLDLGAKYAIDYKTQDFEKVILESTNGQGVDVILDFIAAPYLQQNINSLTFDGRMVLLALMGGVKTEVNLINVLRKRLRIQGSTLRARNLDYKIRLSQELQALAWPHFETGLLQPIVDSVYNWSQAAEAHAYMEANKNQGKIVLTVD